MSHLMLLDSHINRIEPVGLPSLMDSSQRDCFPGSSTHVTCFSDQETEDKRLIHLESKDGSGPLFYPDPLFPTDNDSLMKLLLNSHETQFPGTGTDPFCLAGTGESGYFWNF